MKSYIISGAASGIGLEIARELLAENARVAIIDIKDPPADLNPKDRVLFVKGSSADEGTVASLLKQIQEQWGGIDGLINNTGIMIRKKVEDLSLEEWNKVISTNLTSAFLLSRAAIPLLRKSNGTIINISSTRAHQSEPDTESYASTKGGLLALTHSLAISLGPYIRVHAISPGWIDSRPESEQKKKPLKASDHAQHPVGRVGETRDIALLVLWLLSDASRFITGQEFIVDGGMTRKMIYEE